ncbi:hypothetical protein B2J93_1597 [Marssonina coronariae]|uniref:Uncharacterized protein n=1 Tax=Diplocarpon coronariae TaxID=2795749 RepID=A0A218Z929_9HELO|nr:hypothetical protein JHW43_007170 [Diplocarpon mali]OWP04043.1 hypothetical protein B2J93_1597 [Marssonina coronariae]
MAPIRRYLRITKFSVLECRIYLDNPSLAETWLLSPRNPVLPRIIESVRPLVLPKLREESERSKGKSGKKKGVKDVVVKEEFEVSVFLTETGTRHSLLSKQKTLKEPRMKDIQSNSSKLTGVTGDAPIEVEDEPVMAREGSEEEGLHLQDIPEAEDIDSDGDLFVNQEPRRSKRPRATTGESQPSRLVVEPPCKRRKDDKPEETDDKKKMTMDTTYDGFSIYGRVLCLVVKRRDKKGKAPIDLGGGQATMENWISSTQMPPEDS